MFKGTFNKIKSISTEVRGIMNRSTKIKKKIPPINKNIIIMIIPLIRGNFTNKKILGINRIVSAIIITNISIVPIVHAINKVATTEKNPQKKEIA